MNLDSITLFLEYHLDMTRRIWDSIDHISEEQFLSENVYSRGSIRNLMVHITSTDRRWLAGLKNEPDLGHLDAEDYPTRAAAREIMEVVSSDFTEYVSTLTEEALHQHTDQIAEQRWQILLHLINHGTDHRATVLQQLHEFGAPTFPQDFIIWLWERK